VHESLTSGASGEEGEEAVEGEAEQGEELKRPNPFAALEGLKSGETGDKKH
jgi:uncharacterized protein